MFVDTMSEQSSETYRIAAFYEALKSIPALNDKSHCGEYRMDNLDETDCGPEDETQKEMKCNHRN